MDRRSVEGQEMSEFNFDPYRRYGGGMAPMAPQSRYVLPSYIERTAYGVKEMNPYNKLFEERIIFVGVQIDDTSGQRHHRPDDDVGAY